MIAYFGSPAEKLMSANCMIDHCPVTKVHIDDLATAHILRRASLGFQIHLDYQTSFPGVEASMLMRNCSAVRVIRNHVLLTMSVFYKTCYLPNTAGVNDRSTVQDTACVLGFVRQ